MNAASAGTSARPASGLGRLLARRPLACVAAAFLASRLAYFAAGIRFDAIPLAGFWQIIDPTLLRDDLWRSVHYLHSQPPLFNLFLGLVLKGFRGHEIVAFQAVYLGMGLALAVSVCLLMGRLGVPGVLRTVLAVLFTVSPACILHENWLFYDYPVMLLLVLAAWFLHRFAGGRQARDGVAFFTLLAFAVLTRSLFHPAWFALAVAMLWLGQRRDWKLVAAASCGPFLLVLAWYVKNLAVFGSFVGSTWVGMNFADITTLQVPRPEREALVREGALSPFALIPTFRPLRDYRGILPEAKPTGIPVLDRETKPSGAPNFNHSAYIAVSRAYFRDALAVVRRRPSAYARGVRDAYLRYFIPATDHDWLAGNREKMAALDRIYSVVVCGRFGSGRWPASPEAAQEMGLGQKFLNTGLFLLVGCPVLFLYGLIAARRAFARPEERARALTLLFLCLTIAYVTVAGNALEVGENFRNRFTLAPFYLVLLGLLIGGRRVVAAPNGKAVVLSRDQGPTGRRGPGWR